MKHLLTALIASLFLVLPLNADEPSQTISVRVIDHEDKPISGVSLYSKVGSARAESVTDSLGLASFTVQAQPDAERVWIWPSDTSFQLVNRHRAVKEQPEPDPAALSSYAFDFVYDFDLNQSADGEFTIRVPQTVQCKVKLSVSGISAAGPLGYALQRQGGPYHPWRRPGLGQTDGLNERGFFLRSSLPVVRAQATRIGLFAQGRCYIVELDADRTDAENLSIEVPEPEYTGRRGTIRSLVSDDSDRLRFFLIALNGDHAQEVQLTPARRDSTDGNGRILRASVPSGEFYVDPHSPRNWAWSSDISAANLWSPGSVFDTLLRLRRGEDLPHLKRITIPEGGTVELSTEDFLDPPAETETPAEANPR